jgi:hypothetical protein
MRRKQPGAKQLIFRRRGKVQVRARGGIRPVAGRSLGKKGWRIGVAPAGFAGIVTGSPGNHKPLPVRETPAKMLGQFFTHFIAAGSDGWPNRRAKKPWAAIKLPPHFTHGFLDDTPQHSLPARMNSGHGAPLRVSDQDGHAVGGADCQKQTCLVGDECVASRRLLMLDASITAGKKLHFPAARQPDVIHQRRVDLPKIGKLKSAGAKGVEECLAVSFHPSPRVAGSETQVQAARQSAAACPQASAEGVEDAPPAQSGALKPPYFSCRVEFKRRGS